mmetsp:Transcript_8375/g.15768  ORF Transcript_8375/g.15768 Transcript_8375/m.15768 type:complete len:146 (+) Transcript_8375:171-608(+)|eukprot:CAMPEP_0114435262 /NCGR_PEP_ID=MMETSP0103-20121206/12734_1 /TAXON_ID=37642 ORGANISM="Paraphysomonas imperforata, Strain PA2" /NCGR_SAMPLE_ID=MMETSP0103 /ASSEMBLY_ACC=CAM_ASM_000201 /LENGTH=145 /DNA_ID=CAMNT_0001605271 /DNA_START=169 /DNA_END=606 /DNA_ORIENTATION=+
MAEVTLSIPAVYNSFQIKPKEDEKNDANFPKTVSEAMVLFHRVGKPEFAEELRNNMEAMLQVLQQGPDGKSQVAFGNGCICFECGHVGLPKNNDEASVAKGDSVSPPVDFAFACKKCITSSSVNLVLGMQPDGTVLPWIEKTTSV